MLISFPQLFLLLTAGALLLPTPRRRALALVGAIASGLALAAFSVTLSQHQPRDIPWQVSQVGVPASFLQLNSGLLVLGIGLLLVAAGREWRAVREARLQAFLATLSLLAGAALAARAIIPVGRYVGWPLILGAALLIGAVGFLLSTLSRLGRFLEPWRRLDTVLLERRIPQLLPILPTTADLVWFGGLVAASVAIGFAPSLRAVALATVVAAVAGHVLLRRSGAGAPIPAAPLLALVMIPVFSTLRTIADSENPVIAGLANAPVSTAAEVQLFPWVWLVGFGFAALWPLHGTVYALSAPLSAILLIRLGAHALPGGVAHWAPLLMPVTLLGLWHAAATLGDPTTHRRRVLGLLTAGALFGVLAGGIGETGAWWLIGCAIVYPWIAGVETNLSRLPVGLGRLLWLVPAYGGFMVIEGGLLRQVTWTALVAVGVAVAGWRATMRLY